MMNNNSRGNAWTGEGGGGRRRDTMMDHHSRLRRQQAEELGIVLEEEKEASGGGRSGILDGVIASERARVEAERERTPSHRGTTGQGWG